MMKYTHHRINVCAWYPCSRVFLASTTGVYCSKGCKKQAHNYSGQRAKMGLPHKNPGPIRLKDFWQVECMCLMCHGPLGRDSRVRTCSSNCRTAWKRLCDDPSSNFDPIWEDRRILHAWRREQACVMKKMYPAVLAAMRSA